MNVLVSSSPFPRAHPPRSNPFLRSSSDAPPFPCITPSTVTCVMVVSFKVAVPFSLGRPSWAASHPCYEHLCPDPTPPRGFLSRRSGPPVGSDPTARRFRAIVPDFLGVQTRRRSPIPNLGTLTESPTSRLDYARIHVRL